MEQPFLSTDNTLTRIIIEPRYRWLRHLLIVVLLLFVSYHSMLITFSGNLDVLGTRITYLALLQLAIYVGTIYLNIYVLAPRLFLKSRYVAYFLSLLVVLSVNFACTYFMEYVVTSSYSINPAFMSYIHSDRSLLIDFVSDVLIMAMCCVGSTITILFRNWLTDGKRKQEMEVRQRRERILEVKNSVNPSFLSEILATAARNASPDANLCSDILARLSRFLRYRLYDSNRELVMLNSEVSFLDNYLSLIANVRPGFSYRVTSHGLTAKSVLPPSLSLGITDVILQNVQEEIPLALEIDFETDRTRSLALNFFARSPGIPVSGKIKETVENILDISFPSDYTLAVGTTTEGLFIRICQTQIPLK